MDQAWVARARSNGLHVAVSPVPGFRNGKRPEDFVTTYGFYIAPFDRNRVIASDLLPDYLTRLDVMSAMSARIGAPVACIGATALADTTTRNFLAACNEVVTMPLFAQVPAVWGHFGTS